MEDDNADDAMEVRAVAAAAVAAMAAALAMVDVDEGVEADTAAFAAPADGVAAALDHVRDNMSAVAAGVVVASTSPAPAVPRERCAFATWSLLPSKA